MTALRNADRFLVALFAAHGVANSLGTAFWDHLAHGVGAGLRAALRNHRADRVVAGLLTVFANHLADRVVANLRAAFWDHLASGVVASLLTVFANHGANGVVDRLGTAFWNHRADGVVASLGTAFWDHTADLVFANLRAALRNSTAHGVRNFAGAAFGYIFGAGDFFLLASRNPNFLADRLRATLNALDSASAGAIHGLAGARIKVAGARFANNAADHRAGNGFRHGFPMPTVDRDGLGVRLRNANGVVLGTNFLFLDGVVDRVVDVACTSFVNGNHHGVVSRLLTRFVHRLVDGVVDRLLASFVYRFLNRVVDYSLVLFVHRFHDRVVDRLLTSFVHWFFDRVVDHPCAGFVHGLVDGVVDRFFASLVRRHHDRVLNFPLNGFGNHPRAIDDLVFVIRFVPHPSASLLDLLHHRFANRPHHGVRPGAANRSFADDRFRSGSHDGIAGNDGPAAITAATTLVADRAVCSVSSACARYDRNDREGGQ